MPAGRIVKSPAPRKLRKMAVPILPGWTYAAKQPIVQSQLVRFHHVHRDAVLTG
jgi:hypothetical protein